jgi:hypothetical protein
MNIERLKKCLEAVENLPDVQFDMRNWKREDSCGTVYCAAGAYVAANPDCGLEFCKIEIEFGWAIQKRGGTNLCASIVILADHFDISRKESFTLFNGANYMGLVTKEMVAERIRNFIKESNEKA